ncbi:CBN-TLI-1 protein [Caenorhabditis brenneri]|uniref:CBN-TLI-1 protein n=1 Tax=Caenorhabditis brenneri TaxID=135651 RepID=G0NY05_CAEBE|nr:CBN-TLI-1 protein [Caenorhabditis brenneri]
MNSETVAERRKKVLVGELPPHFLRLAVPVQQVAEPEIVQPRLVSFVPPNTRGRLSVTILEANLVKNYGLVRMDPYCRVRVGNVAFDTNVAANGGRAPTWNRTLNAYLPMNVESIYIQIFDEKAFGPDEVIAWAHIMLPLAIFNGDNIDEYFQLSGQQGEGKEGMIHLHFSFAPIELPLQSEVMPQQDVVPAPLPVEITEEDTKEIQEMFPSVDKEVIKCILEERRGDKEAAVSAILEMTSASETA